MLYTDLTNEWFYKGNIEKTFPELQEITDYLMDFFGIHGDEDSEKFIDYLITILLPQKAIFPNILMLSARFPIFNNFSYQTAAKMDFTESWLVRRIRNYTRWNAVAMVLNAGKSIPGIGGHLSTFESISSLYEVGFDYFWKGNNDKTKSDFIYFQGHSSPGIYARSFLEGILTEDDLNNFRNEVFVKGLSSYPHPHLMPEYWQFPTVSLGLGAMQGVAQALWIRYLECKGFVEKNPDRHVWVFLGDAEMEEPESFGLARLAYRYNLNNLIFIVNCNLLGLDGPVYGNGNIVFELERIFSGYGWRVIKAAWDFPLEILLDMRNNRAVAEVLENLTDGDLIRLESQPCGFVRALFDEYLPHLKETLGINDWAEDVNYGEKLYYGGNSVEVVYASYHRALNPSRIKDRPTAILARTIKGSGFDSKIRASYSSHSQKKLSKQQLVNFANKLDIGLVEKDLAGDRLPYVKFEKKSDEYKFMMSQREKLNGPIPNRRYKPETLHINKFYEKLSVIVHGSENRELSTTMIFGMCLTTLFNDPILKDRLIVVTTDEARTFGIEPLFNKIGIFDPGGQNYTPNDAGSLLQYRVSKQGQFFQMGINETGAMAMWLTAATSYVHHEFTAIPFFIYYSIFGFQRFGDLVWASADSKAKGFVIGGTAGRTTLNGEGLQHEDGHNLVMWSYVPGCKTYDPTFGYEVAIIMYQGLKDMYENNNCNFYYMTVMNENHLHPPLLSGSEENILKGLYVYRSMFANHSTGSVNLVGSGTITLEVIAAGQILRSQYNIDSKIYIATSYGELRKNCEEVTRQRIYNNDTKMKSHVEIMLDNDNPIVAASDYIKSNAEQIRQHISNDYYVLGTDGLGRSGSRADLRTFFEVDRYTIAYVALYAMSKKDSQYKDKLEEFIKKNGLKLHDKKNPMEC